MVRAEFAPVRASSRRVRASSRKFAQVHAEYAQVRAGSCRVREGGVVICHKFITSLSYNRDGGVRIDRIIRIRIRL
jgi:hypothetical protein